METNTILPAQKQVTVVIPSYEPDEKLMKIVTGLEEAGFDDIVVVDDGSEEANKKNFPRPEEHPGLTLLVHPKNRGKGAALRTAFTWILENRKDRAGVVTADGDAQHRVEDILKCSQRMLEEQNKLVLGVRNFSLPHVPKRSRVGNRITCILFRVLCGVRISDTQTGLRAVPAAYLENMLEIKGDRYEYETNMLLDLKGMGLACCEEPIETVYIEENQTSHFRPIRDSLRIYSLILKYLASSLTATFLDLLLFYLLSKFWGPHLPSLYNEFICTAVARVLSSIVNFAMNKELVFHRKGGVAVTLARYVALSVPVMLVSAGSVKLLSWLFDATIPSLKTVFKMVVDTLLYFINFRVQSDWVFAQKKEHK